MSTTACLAIPPANIALLLAAAIMLTTRDAASGALVFRSERVAPVAALVVAIVVLALTLLVLLAQDLCCDHSAHVFETHH